MQMFTAPRIEPPFEAQAAIERVASALGWEILGIIGNHCGDIRAFSERGDMRFQVRLPISLPYESAL
jgi:hypothetical protein